MEHADVLRLAAQKFGLTAVTQIASGGQKVVASAIANGTPVVVKSVLLSGTTDPHALERCEREVMLLKDLRDSNIVQVLSDLEVVNTPPEAAYWIEEYLDGQDLADLVSTGAPWTWTEAEEFLLQVSSGLATMHRSNYIHRDLSAKNVRLTVAGIWKILDPGFAKHLDRSSITGLFQPGTPGYMSPEHASPGIRVTPASDVHSLGILVYFGLTGLLPIPVGGDLNGYRLLLLHGDPPSVSGARPDLTAEQCSIIDGCLARQPARRWLDAAELHDELNKLKGTI